MLDIVNFVDNVCNMRFTRWWRHFCGLVNERLYISESVIARHCGLYWLLNRNRASNNLFILIIKLHFYCKS